MCLSAKSGIQVATEDMVVYKGGKFELNKFSPSGYRNYWYAKGQHQPHIELTIDESYGKRPVNEGYHSWKHSPFLFGLFGEKVNAIFAIPKGAKYIYGEQYNDAAGYVSSDIVFIGKNTFLFRWKIRLGLIKVKDLIEKLPEKKEVLEKSATFGDY